MAKIKSKIAEELRKSLSQGSFQIPVTARTDKFGKITLSSSTAPGPSKTPNQSSWRDRYHSCVTIWNSLTPEEKAAYQEDADKRKITAFNQFMSSCLLIPPKFTFGYEVAGGSGSMIAYVDPTKYGAMLRGTVFWPEFDGTLDEMWANIRMPLVEPWGYDLELGIYEWNGWGIDSHKLIAHEKEKHLSTSGWHRVYNFHESITAWTPYILVAIAHIPGVPPWPVQIDLAYDPRPITIWYQHSFLDWRWQDPWYKMLEGMDRSYSIYCVYHR